MASATTLTPHPLLNRPGTSQLKRQVDLASNSGGEQLMDGRSLVDILDYIHKYAHQVVFHECKSDDAEGEYIELSNWLAFFEKSLPFQLAKFHKTNFAQLECEWIGIESAFENDPATEHLKLLLDFCFFELFIPVENLQKQVAAFDFNFVPFLGELIRSQALPSLRRYIQLSNTANKYFCIERKDFSSFIQAPWSLLVEDLNLIDEELQHTSGGNQGAMRWLKEELSKIANQQIRTNRQIAESIPAYLEASLTALNGKHEAHLGLLFAFLRLFRDYQGNLNKLSKRHLDFFYKEVLKFKAKDLQPDQAHLVFELSKHLKAPYAIKKDTAFKDGKDANNIDVLFNLDEEIVIDAAQIKDLRTLHLNTTEYRDGADVKTYLEGLYIAPVANSADGKGELFKADQAKNWATLGSKTSKYTPVGSSQPQDHEKGRLGFILASPVLWLNEGNRKITLKLRCKLASSQALPDELFLTDWFTLQFSGEEGWFSPQTKFDCVSTVAGADVELTFTGSLDAGEPKVVFYAADKIKEAFDIHAVLPMVKIELNPAASLDLDKPAALDPCGLLNEEDPNQSHKAALYHYLKNLKINTAKIEVEVCGVKNLLVQNEESLQDVNGLILPFGSRPKVGAEFYIGSKEVFGKNSEEIYLYIDWKDRPKKLEKHYEDYYSGEVFEDESTEINEESFKLEIANLIEGGWLYEEREEPRNLFAVDEPSGFCDKKADNIYRFERKQDTNAIQLDPKSLDPLSVNTRDSFIKLVLGGVSFQHERFALVLARKLIELSRDVDPAKLGKLIDVFKRLMTLISSPDLDEESTLPGLAFNKGLEELLKILGEKINQLDTGDELSYGISEVDGLNSKALENIKDVIGQLKRLIKDFPSINVSQLKSLGELLDKISTYSSKLGIITGRQGEVLPGDNRKPLQDQIKEIETILGDINKLVDNIKGQIGKEIEIFEKKEYSLPKEPYTPLIKSIWIDYKASSVETDITLIHLHPFANTSKVEAIQPGTTLLPHFTDEGTLFIGIDQLRPGAILQLLFQFAEATADSESSRANVAWHYLKENQWVELKDGFHILEDATKKLTRSGIVKLAIPDDASNVNNTIMPPTEEGKHLYWIKASAPTSVAAVAEVVGVHLHGALATYLPIPKQSDTSRVGTALAPEQISKTLQPDFNLKKITQPYESFGGRLPESDKEFYIRISEHLRHKGRSVDTFDIEHLVLEAFPLLFKCKCISHTFSLSANKYHRDLEAAPGFVTVALIPDLTKLKAGNSLQPKVPLSILEEIKDFLTQRMSPFARIQVMNPRYEPVNVEIRVAFKSGFDENFYKDQLKTDLVQYLAPWHLGDSDKLSFGQAILYTDVVGFVENLDYVDYITNLELSVEPGSAAANPLQKIEPKTARSILTPGEITIELDRFKCQDHPIDPTNMKSRLQDLIRKPSKIAFGKAQAFLSAYRNNVEPLD